MKIIRKGIFRNVKIVNKVGMVTAGTKLNKPLSYNHTYVSTATL